MFSYKKIMDKLMTPKLLDSESLIEKYAKKLRDSVEDNIDYAEMYHSKKHLSEFSLDPIYISEWNENRFPDEKDDTVYFLQPVIHFKNEFIKELTVSTYITKKQFSREVSLEENEIRVTTVNKPLRNHTAPLDNTTDYEQIIEYLLFPPAEREYDRGFAPEKEKEEDKEYEMV